MNEETIFAVAREKKTPAERQAYLDQACAKNTGVRAAVEELLRADDDAGSFLEHAPAGMEATVASEASSRDTVDDGLWATALPFLKAGVPVLVEKPMARSLAEADEMIAAAAESGAALAVGHTERFNPAVADLQGQPVKDSLSRQQFGASVGFPLKRDKSFLFLAFEGLHQNAQNAVRAMIDHVTGRTSLSREDAYLLCSLCVDLKISEIVDAGQYVVSAVLPEAVFTSG